MTQKAATTNANRSLSKTSKNNMTLAGIYLEEKLNSGLSIEIPSLGVTITRKKAIKENTNSHEKQFTNYSFNK